MRGFGCAPGSVRLNLSQSPCYPCGTRSRSVNEISVQQAPSLVKSENMAREFRRSCKQKSYELYMLSRFFPVSSNILMRLMESWCIVFVGNQFFFGQNWPKEGFWTLWDSFFPQTLFTYCIHISTSLNIWARGRLNRQGELCFLNSEMPKKVHACQGINKSTERHAGQRERRHCVRGLVRNAQKALQCVLPCATQREARPSLRDSRH